MVSPRIRGSRRRAVWRALAGISFALLPFLVLAPHSLGVWTLDALERAENYFYDLRVRATMPGGVNPNSRVVIVDIDETSIGSVGRYPWSRRVYANLLDKLFDDYGAEIVAFDVFFPEAEEQSAVRLLDEQTAATTDTAVRARLLAQRQRFAADDRFAESLIARNVVLGFSFKSLLGPAEKASTGELPPALQIEGQALQKIPWLRAAGYIGNLPQLQGNAAAGGFFDTPTTDHDGVVRRTPLLQQYDGKIYESLGLATARLARGGQPLRLAFAQERSGTQRLEYVAVGSTRVPVDRRGIVLTPYRGHVFSFPYIPAHKVLDGTAAHQQLAGKIVLVGTSAAGLNDIRPTPVDAQYVGVETHANLVEGILEDTVLAVPSWARWFDFMQLMVLAALFAFWLPRLSQTATFVVVVLLAVTIAGVNLAAWRRSGVVLPLATPLLYLTTAAVLLINFRFFVERQRKRHLSRVFGQYVPPEIVSELDRTEADVSLEGESRDMSVLFSDVRGFTTLSEGLSPRDLTRLMNEMLTPLTRVIHTQRGTIDKYMGDAIMAFWGAPLADGQHAEHAVQAALGMVQAAAQLRAEFATRGWPPVHIGVGVSSGAMNVGNMGSEFRMAYTVLGDAVNLGSRLESLTKQYGVDIIVSAATSAAVNSVTFRELDLVRVKGKNEPVAIFEPLGLVGDIDAATMRRVEQFTAALREYRRGHFAAAANLWREMLAERAESLIEIYLDRCRGFQQTPPPDSWDGVYVHHTK